MATATAACTLALGTAVLLVAAASAAVPHTIPLGRRTHTAEEMVLMRPLRERRWNQAAFKLKSGSPTPLIPISNFEDAEYYGEISVRVCDCVRPCHAQKRMQLKAQPSMVLNFIEHMYQLYI